VVGADEVVRVDLILDAAESMLTCRIAAVLTKIVSASEPSGPAL